MAGADDDVGAQSALDPSDIFTDLPGRALGHEPLGIDASHECNPSLEFPGQEFSLHVGCLCLQRMQAIDSGCNQPFNHGVYRSA